MHMEKRNPIKLRKRASHGILDAPKDLGYEKVDKTHQKPE